MYKDFEVKKIENLIDSFDEFEKAKIFLQYVIHMVSMGTTKYQFNRFKNSEDFFKICSCYNGVKWKENGFAKEYTHHCEFYDFYFKFLKT